MFQFYTIAILLLKFVLTMRTRKTIRFLNFSIILSKISHLVNILENVKS